MLKKKNLIHLNHRFKKLSFPEFTTNHLVSVLFFLCCALLPSQFGKHFFLPYSYITGVRIDYLAPTLYLTDIITFCLLLCFVKQMSAFFRQKKIIVLYLILISSIVLSHSPEIAMYRFVRYVQFAAVLVVFGTQYNKYKKIIAYGFASGIFLQTPLIISQTITSRSLQGVWYWLGERMFTLATPGIAKVTLQGNELLRPYGSFSHPNSMAGFFLLLYGFFLVERSIRNVTLKSVLLVLCTLLIFLSFSKNAILAYLIINTYYVSRQKISCVLCKFTKMVVPVCVALLFLSGTTDVVSFEKRARLFTQSIILLLKHPFGVGLGNYLYAQSSFKITYPYFFLQPVHNIFLLFMVEVGVVGFLLLLYYVKPKKIIYTQSLTLIMMIVVFTGMFDHYWLTLQQNFLLAAAIGGIVLYNEV